MNCDVYSVQCPGFAKDLCSLDGVMQFLQPQPEALDVWFAVAFSAEQNFLLSYHSQRLL